VRVDRRIETGARWKEQIRNALGRARVAVLLVSRPFLASDFIEKHELPELLGAEKGLSVVWIPVVRAAVVGERGARRGRKRVGRCAQCEGRTMPGPVRQCGAGNLGEGGQPQQERSAKRARGGSRAGGGEEVEMDEDGANHGGLFSFQRRTARRLGVHAPAVGAVALVQRFGSSLQLTPHFCLLAVEGVFEEHGGDSRAPVLLAT